MENKEKKVFVYYRESFLQAVLSDVVTFGFLIFSIWFSRGDNLWTFFCIVLFVIFTVGKASARVNKFYSAKELKDFVDKQFKA